MRLYRQNGKGPWWVTAGRAAGDLLAHVVDSVEHKAGCNVRR